jgi:hypothetical protein
LIHKRGIHPEGKCPLNYIMESLCNPRNNS